MVSRSQLDANLMPSCGMRHSVQVKPRGSLVAGLSDDAKSSDITSRRLFRVCRRHAIDVICDAIASVEEIAFRTSETSGWAMDLSVKEALDVHHHIRSMYTAAQSRARFRDEF